MKLNYRQKAWASFAGIVASMACCSYLILNGTLNSIAIVFVAFGCYPWAKYIFNVLRYEKRNTVRMLKKALPKCGFTVEETELLDGKSMIRFKGEYQGESFFIDANPSSPYVTIIDLPWLGIKASDPSIPRVLEALNETNLEASNISVYMAEPDDEGDRSIYSVSKTILPTFKTHEYLVALMCEMLNRKKAFRENFDKERPWMNQRRGTIGFNVNALETPSEETKISAKADEA